MANRRGGLAKTTRVSKQIKREDEVNALRLNRKFWDKAGEKFGNIMSEYMQSCEGSGDEPGRNRRHFIDRFVAKASNDIKGKSGTSLKIIIRGVAKQVGVEVKQDTEIKGEIVDVTPNEESEVNDDEDSD